MARSVSASQSKCTLKEETNGKTKNRMGIVLNHIRGIVASYVALVDLKHNRIAKTDLHSDCKCSYRKLYGILKRDII